MELKNDLPIDKLYQKMVIISSFNESIMLGCDDSDQPLKELVGIAYDLFLKIKNANNDGGK